MDNIFNMLRRRSLKEHDHQLTHKLDPGNWRLLFHSCPWNVCSAHYPHSGSSFQGWSTEGAVCCWDHQYIIHLCVGRSGPYLDACGLPHKYRNTLKKLYGLAHLFADPHIAHCGREGKWLAATISSPLQWVIRLAAHWSQLGAKAQVKVGRRAEVKEVYAGVHYSATSGLADKVKKHVDKMKTLRPFCKAEMGHKLLRIKVWVLITQPDWTLRGRGIGQTIQGLHWRSVVLSAPSAFRNPVRRVKTKTKNRQNKQPNRKNQTGHGRCLWTLRTGHGSAVPNIAFILDTCTTVLGMYHAVMDWGNAFFQYNPGHWVTKSFCLHMKGNSGLFKCFSKSICMVPQYVMGCCWRSALFSFHGLVKFIHYHGWWHRVKMWKLAFDVGNSTDFAGTSSRRGWLVNDEPTENLRLRNCYKVFQKTLYVLWDKSLIVPEVVINKIWVYSIPKNLKKM